jgi:hypothetical protein
MDARTAMLLEIYRFRMEKPSFLSRDGFKGDAAGAARIISGAGNLLSLLFPQPCPAPEGLVAAGFSRRIFGSTRRLLSKQPPPEAVAFKG